MIGVAEQRRTAVAQQVAHLVVQQQPAMGAVLDQHRMRQRVQQRLERGRAAVAVKQRER